MPVGAPHMTWSSHTAKSLMCITLQVPRQPRHRRRMYCAGPSYGNVRSVGQLCCAPGPHPEGRCPVWAAASPARVGLGVGLVGDHRGVGLVGDDQGGHRELANGGASGRRGADRLVRHPLGDLHGLTEV